MQNPPALCTCYDHLSNAIVNTKKQSHVKICPLKAGKKYNSDKICILLKRNLINSARPTFYDSLATYVYEFFVHFCAYACLLRAADGVSNGSQRHLVD